MYATDTTTNTHIELSTVAYIPATCHPQFVTYFYENRERNRRANIMWYWYTETQQLLSNCCCRCCCCYTLSSVVRWTTCVPVSQLCELVEAAQFPLVSAAGYPVDQHVFDVIVRESVRDLQQERDRTRAANADVHSPAPMASTRHGMHYSRLSSYRTVVNTLRKVAFSQRQKMPGAEH